MEWHVRGARGGVVTGTILEGEEYPCAFCKGTGVVAKTNSQCPVCRGQKTIKVTPPAVTCAYCRGRGEVSPRSNVTCIVCRGRGVVSVRTTIEACPGCRGRGAAGGGHLPCTTCQGKGVVPRQSGRMVAPSRKRAMAQERARIMGRKRTPPSPIELAAAQWEKRREARAKEASEETLRLSRATEVQPFSLQQVSLRTDGVEADEEASWKSYAPPEHGEAKRHPRRRGHISVMSMARKIISRERAGCSGRVAADPRARAMEQAARNWERERRTRDSK